MAAPRVYSDEVRESIHELMNTQGLSATAARPLIIDKHGEAPSEIRMREIARDARKLDVQPIGDKALAEALDYLAREAMELVNQEFAALAAKKTQLDADQLLKLVRSLKELQPLAQAKPATETDDNTHTGLLSTLKTHDTTHTRKPRDDHHDPVRSRATSEVHEIPASLYVNEASPFGI